MKNLIFRIDYNGILEFQDFLKVFSKQFGSVFKSYQMTYVNSIEINLDDVAQISELLSIPIKEFEKQEVHRFTDSNLGEDEITLDITKFYTCLTINCKNYENSDKYQDFFAQYIYELKNRNAMIGIKRLGLRKIGGKVFTEMEDIFKDFEKTYFNFDFSRTEFKSYRNQYIDVLRLDETSPEINFVRSFDMGKQLMHGKYADAYQVTYDIDGYMLEEALMPGYLTDYESILKMINKINNEFLFKIFKMSMTEEFLNSHSK